MPCLWPKLVYVKCLAHVLAAAAAPGEGSAGAIITASRPLPAAGGNQPAVAAQWPSVLATLPTSCAPQDEGAMAEVAAAP